MKAINYTNELKIKVQNIKDKLTGLDNDAYYWRLSDEIHNMHESLYKTLDFRIVEPKSCDPVPLTSTEKYFLKALSGQFIDELSFPIYWTIEYLINYSELITKLLESRYVTLDYPSDDISFLTGEQLKAALRFLKLKVSGKKQELIERLLNSGSTIEALKHIGQYKKQFVLTPLGKETLMNLPPSATKNIELEDKCLSLIQECKFNEAYKIICKWECEKLMQRGIGVNLDWERDSKVGLSERQIKTYMNYWNNNTSFEIYDNGIDFTLELKSSIILGEMLGVSYDKTALILQRIAPNIKTDTELIKKSYIP